MRIKTVIAAVMLLMLGSFSYAQQNVVGYNKINIPANTDVRLTVPFTTTQYNGSGVQDSAAVFTATGANAGTINVAAGSLSLNKFNATDVTKSSYYVRFLTGNAAGLWMTIKSHDNSSFTLDDTLTTQRSTLIGKVASGDTFRVYKHHTISSVFPPAMYGGSYVTNTTLLLYQNNIGSWSQNPPAQKQVTYNSGFWFGTGVDGTTILRPDTQFILRNSSTQTLTMVTNGTVPDYSVSVLIAQNGDAVIGSGYPVPVVLRESGLAGTNRTVLFFDNQATGQNKPATKQATYNSGFWLGAGVTGNELLAPSEVIKLRLPGAEAGTIVTIKKPY